MTCSVLIVFRGVSVARSSCNDCAHHIMLACVVHVVKHGMYVTCMWHIWCLHVVRMWCVHVVCMCCVGCSGEVECVCCSGGTLVG